MTTLLVASTGGHLKELHHLYKRLPGAHESCRWVTFDTPQSRSLLEGEDVDFVPFVGGRDPLNIVRNLSDAYRILRNRDIDMVVSTGSAVALPYVALARARQVHCHYIESAARIDGPSMTGRLIMRIPGVNLYTQYPVWASRRWAYGGSVFDVFAPAAPVTTQPPRPTRVVVTLGTYRGYGFPRLVARLLQILPPGTDVLWQTGDTDTGKFGVSGHYAIPEQDLIQAMREADVVIAHAGVGTALAALEVGRCPLLVPRRLSLGEHVDDHQIQVARELSNRGLAVSVDADDLSYDDLIAVAPRRVETVAQAPVFLTSDALSKY